MNVRMKFSVTITLASVSLLALVACSATNAGGGTAGSGGIVPIGYSAVFLQDPAQSAMAQLFESDAKKRDLATLSPKSANGDVTTQDNDIRSLVTAGARGLLVVPTDPSALVPALEYATGQGLKVASLMSGPVGGKADISLVVDNYVVGKQACEYLAEKVGPTGTVLHVQGDLRSTVGQQRDAGFQDCVKEKYPKMTLIAKTGGQWDPATAATSVAAVLISNPELGGIYMASDGYADPVAQTLASAGKTAPAGETGHVWTISVDGTPSALEAIRKRKLDATLSQPVTDFVTHALDYLEVLSAGGTIEVGPTDHASKVVKTKDGYPEDVFPTTLITTENVDADTNWANKI